MKKLFTLAAAVLASICLMADVVVQVGNAGNSAGDAVTLTSQAGTLSDGVTARHLYVMSGGSTYTNTDIQNTAGIDVQYGNVASTSTRMGSTSNLGPKLPSANKSHLQVSVESGDSVVIYWFHSSTFSDKTMTVSKKKASDPVNGEKVTDVTGIALGTSKRTGCTGWKSTITDTAYFAFNQSLYVYAVKIIPAPTCDDPNATIIADASGFVGDEIDLEFSSDNTSYLEWDVTLDGEPAVGDQDYSWAADGVFKPQKPGTFVVTAEQEADGTHCAVAESVTLTITAKTPVEEVIVAGPDAGFIGIPITLTATAEGATAFRWMDADNSVIPGATEATYTFTPDVAGTWKFNCQARNQFNVDGSDNPTWQASEIKFITVTHASGELIKAVLNGGNSATVTGVLGGTFDSNLSSGKYKIDKNVYAGVVLANGAFQEGDTVIITMTVKGGNYPCLFGDKARTNCLYLATEGSDALEYRFILPAAATGLTSLYLSRGDDTDDYKWNPTVASISVVRPKFVKSSTETLTGVAIDGVGISAAAFEGLLEAHNYGTSAEYVNAPTVTFVKHVVVTYEDDTQAERDEEVEVVAEDKGDYFEAKATIGGIEYSIETDKSTVYTVVFKDGEDELGSENVEVGSHPTAENIELPAKEFQSFAAWQKDGEDIALSDVSAAAGETITLVARYAKVYSQSINIEQIVLDNSTKYDIKGAFAEKGIVAIDINDLDTLNDLDKKDNRNYAFLGLKVKKSTSTIAVLLANEATLRVKFGNVGNAVNVKIGDAEPVAKSAEDLAEPFVYTNETGADIVVRFVSSGTKTVVFKQIMINEAIAEVVLPDPSAYALTINASAGGTVKAAWGGAEKDLSKVNAPINENIVLNITPASGYAIGLVKYEGTNTGSITIYPDGDVYQFTMPEEAVTVSVAFEVAIASVSLDVVFPLVGTEIENKIYGPTDNVAIITVPEGANYELTMYDFWEEGGNVELEGALVENTTYEIRITVMAKAGFAFASNAPILVNGVAAEHIVNDAEFNRRDFTVSFQPRAIEEITEVAITIPSFPKLNETVGTNSFEASVPDGAGYQIMNKAFFDNESNLLSNSYVLVAGTYIVEIGIWPKDGYAFPATPTDDADTEKITITVNGDAPHSTYGAWAGGPVLFVLAQFTVSDPTGMGNTEVEGKTVKMIENGQLIIIKNGVRYNALGEMIK